MLAQIKPPNIFVDSPLSEQHRDRIATHYASIVDKSDRDMAIVTADSLSDQLQSLIKRWFPLTASNQILGGFGFLSNFANRIAFCRLIYLLPDSTCNHLDTIRRIRNDFAHPEGRNIAFNTPPVKDRVNALRTLDFKKPTTLGTGDGSLADWSTEKWRFYEAFVYTVAQIAGEESRISLQSALIPIAHAAGVETFPAIQWMYKGDRT